MNEIDLIPADYRQLRRLRRDFQRFGTIFVCLVLAIALGKGWLVQSIRAEKTEIDQLKRGEVSVLNQRRQLEELEGRQADLKARLEVLDALRGGPPAQKMFVALDRALDPSVWFTDWKFVREGEIEEAKPQTRQTGYFIVVPKGAQKNGNVPWNDRTRMEIRGQALSHSDLAGFVQRLLAQPEIVDVNLLNTGTRRYTFREIVEFRLAALIDSRGQG